MSSDVSLARATTIVWNEQTILESGVSFLNQKNEELKVYNNLWSASIGTDYYSGPSQAAAKKFKAIAEKSRKEIERLDNAVTAIGARIS